MRVILSDETLSAYSEPTGAMRVGDEISYDSIRGVVLTPGGASL